MNSLDLTIQTAHQRNHEMLLNPTLNFNFVCTFKHYFPIYLLQY
jgi:hypothetical protein